MTNYSTRRQIADKAARRLHGVKTGPLQGVRSIKPLDPSNKLLRGLEGIKKPMKAKGGSMLDRAMRKIRR